MRFLLLLIFFSYAFDLDAFSALKKVCPVPPIVVFNPDSLEKKIFCPKCPAFTTVGYMGLPLNSTSDFAIEYTLKVGNLWLAVYHSFECEAHSNNYGGYILFSKDGKVLSVRREYPGLCQNLSADDILCLNHFMAQGVINTWIWHCRITPKYKLSCKDIFRAVDDANVSEEGKSQYISALYIKSKNRFYFEVNQDGKLHTIHCQRKGKTFICEGLKNLKRRKS